MTSNAPARCCTIGFRHEGEAKGEYGKIGDVETYFSYPADKSTDKAILLLTDIIGHRFINAQLIADQFAELGFFVAVPDLFDSNPVLLNPPEGFDIFAWIQGKDGKRAHLPPQIDPIIDAAIVELRTKYGVKKLGAAGYCFGAKYVVRHLRPDQGKIDVGFLAHPSFVDADELKAIQGPVSIAAAETDQIFTVEKRHESEEILPTTKQPYQITLYSGTEHGFSVRGDISKKPVKFAKEQAFAQAGTWFETFLA